MRVALFSALIVSLAIDISLHFFDPAPEVWSEDFSKDGYIELRAKLGPPIYTHGLMYDEGEFTAIPQGWVGSAGKTPVFFYDIWVEGWEVGDLLFFPKVLAVEYSRFLEYCKHNDTPNPCDEENIVTRFSWFWMRPADADKYEYGVSGFKI
ncbi:hypothetical protein [uncultured Aliiroseovarius sp.]|uniref:hypothetical protein n=1 Tax=uncultured Aliiroseovarius sp. TaxID=1658783 RepID=UPI002613AD6F|nr:hypothetical protein [uncultured Aliiroseovarius sp.]